METCRTCKWWRRDGVRGRCGRQGCLGAPSEPATLFMVDLEEGEELEYGSSWPSLYTGPDFGCVLHESR